MVSFGELLAANIIQTDAVTQLLIEKGTITEEEFYSKLKIVQCGYEKTLPLYNYKRRKRALVGSSGVFEDIS